MRRLAIAGVLALGALACSQQRASAWCKFNFSIGMNICYESSGHCWSFGASCYSPPCPYGGYGFSGFGGYPAYDALAAYPAAAPAAATAPSSNFTAPKPTPGTSTPSSGAGAYYGTQPVSYSYYGQGGYGYGGYGPSAFQAPGYWYDR